MGILRAMGAIACAGVLAVGCGAESPTTPSRRCAPAGCPSSTDECRVDAECGENELCELGGLEPNTCRPVEGEPEPTCDGKLVVWELSVTEDIPVGDGVIVNPLQLGSVDVSLGVDGTPPMVFDAVPLPVAPEVELRFSFEADDSFDAAIAVEHPENRFRTFGCAFTYDELLASQGLISCVLLVDGETVLEDDPTPTVQLKVSYDIASECGVSTEQPGLLRVDEVRVFELIDHPDTGPNTPRQFATVDARLTFEATKIEPVTIDDVVPFSPSETLELPVDWDGRVSVNAVVELADRNISVSCMLEFSDALRIGAGFEGSDVSPGDRLVPFSEYLRGYGEVHCLDATDPTLMMQLDYALSPVWQRPAR